MRKIFYIIIFLLLAACGRDKEGGVYFGLRGSTAFYHTASKSEIADYEKEAVLYFTRFPTYELCFEWDNSYNNENRRRFISKALIAKGIDPLYCRNPIADQMRRAQDKAKQEKSEKEYYESLGRITLERRESEARDELERLRTDPNYKIIK